MATYTYKRCVLRSNSSNLQIERSEVSGLRRSPRHLPAALKEEISKPAKEREPDISFLPLIVFQGRINYVNDFHACAMICDEIIKEVEKREDAIVPLGFDLEWPFSFQTGSGKTALAQICLSNAVCHLLHIYSLNKLPAALVVLLSHPKVRLVGVNIKNDIWKLGRDFKEFPAKQVVEINCIDTGVFANKVLKRSCRWSLERLTAYLLKQKIDKDPQVRKSKWHVQPLSNAQRIYAATDAYVSLLLHTTIEKKEKELMQSKEADNLTVRLLRAGRMGGYGAGLRLQRELVDQHIKKTTDISNTLVIIEHNPVYTVGIRSKGYTEDDEKMLRNLGAEFHRTNRGGLITFHGPGQLVAYPILDLKQFVTSIKWYVSQIEKMIIRLCAEYGLKATTSPDTGVWVNDRKICAIGIHGSRYITTHGLALNCNTDLSWFSHIVPCGIEGKEVTSITKELGMETTIDDVLPLFANAFENQFNCSLIEYPPSEASKLLRRANKCAMTQ